MNKKKIVLILFIIMLIIAVTSIACIVLKTKKNGTNENEQEESQPSSGMQIATSEDYKSINIMTDKKEDVGIQIEKDITTQIDEATIETKNAIGVNCKGNVSLANSAINSQNYTALVIEDNGTVTIDTTDIISSGKGISDNREETGGIIIYSLNDKIENMAKFTAINSIISISNDSKEFYSTPMFFVKNNKAEINLENTVITCGSNILLKTEGEGTEITLNTKMQMLEGNIETTNDEIINVNLTEETNFIGAINLDNNAKEVNVNISENSLWMITADTYVTTIIVEDKSLNNIMSGGHNIYYDSTNEKNSWLEGQTILLNDGGYLIPQ